MLGEYCTLIVFNKWNVLCCIAETGGVEYVVCNNFRTCKFGSGIHVMHAQPPVLELNQHKGRSGVVLDVVLWSGVVSTVNQ